MKEQTIKQTSSSLPDPKFKREVIRILKDSTGGTVVKNSPVNTGGTGPIPGPGRFHTPQGS